MKNKDEIKCFYKILFSMLEPERCKSYTHQRETTVSSNDSLPLRPFSKWELFAPIPFKSTLGELPWVLLFLSRTCVHCENGFDA